MATPNLSAVLFGPAFCGVAAACHWWRYRRITRGGAEAYATVVAVVEEEAADSSDRAYRPTIAYRTAAGQDLRAACSGYHDTLSRPDDVGVGDVVSVLYHPDRPEVIILARRYWGGDATLAVIAAAWSVAGGLLIPAND